MKNNVSMDPKRFTSAIGEYFFRTDWLVLTCLASEYDAFKQRLASE